MLVRLDDGERLGSVTDDGATFDVFRDRATGLIFCRPFLSELSDYKRLYAGDAYHVRRQRDVGHLPYRDRFDHDREIARQRLQTLREVFPDADSVLDVGCSNGALVAVALDEGLDAYGCDLNPDILRCAEALDERLTGRLFVYDFETGAAEPSAPSLPDCTLRALVLNDVVEHVIDPVAGLGHLRQFMGSSRTALIIDTPDTDSEGFRTRGAGWHHVRPVEHAYLFNERNLMDVVRAAFPEAELLRTTRPIPGKVVVYVLI